MGMTSIGFMVTVSTIYPQKDNSINSLCGLCFIFAPVLGTIVSATALIVEWHVSKEGKEPLLARVLVGYAITLGSCVVQTATVCLLIGTTRKSDSAYQGLIQREFWCIWCAREGL
eukprot:TRINITY_DN5309_c0_g1_i20.p2 TRINITY_DN5309_c0_g1~~TRINITY_DN5309_c0_g1_i20.p2  ORF type:complete len:115 (+),score=18.09 TRINITY_DN5309_c0_g1_i20:334-678(+)